MHVYVIVKEVCNAVVRVLQPRYISFPSGEELQSVIEGFERMWDVHQRVGVIDGSHIPVLGQKITILTTSTERVGIRLFCKELQINNIDLLTFKWDGQEGFTTLVLFLIPLFTRRKWLEHYYLNPLDSLEV